MENKRWLDRPIHPLLPAITNEVMVFALVMLMAIATRFFQLEPRVMSHDESLHTYFSYLLYKGNGYQHTPMMHGPFQFHILALTYYLFGVSDFTARIPAVLFSIATVWMVWYWRRYLGRAGALIAGFLLVISPYMLYYGRYVRNESFVGLSGIVMLYVMLRYLESGEKSTFTCCPPHSSCTSPRKRHPSFMPRKPCCTWRSTSSCAFCANRGRDANNATPPSSSR